MNRRRRGWLLWVGAWAWLVLGLAACSRTTPQMTLPYHTPPAAEAATARPPTPSPTPAIHALVTPRPPQVLGSLYERRLLSVAWPRRLREGDSDWVRLRLEVDEQGTITPTVTAGGHDVTGQPVQIPNLYETHHIYLQARLDAAGLQVEPTGTARVALQPGQPVEVYWTLRGHAAGSYQAVLSASLHLVPKAPGVFEREFPLAHQLFRVQVLNFLGLSGFWVRLGGALSTLLGVLLQLPDLLALWERLRGRGGKGGATRA